MVKHGNVGIVALQTAEEWVVLGSLMHHSIKNLNPSLQMRLNLPLGQTVADKKIAYLFK
jgi:hypothetical protein